MLKLGTTGVSTTYKKAYLGDNLVYDGYAGIKTTPNSNNYVLNNSANGKNKGNIKIGNGPVLQQMTTTGKNVFNVNDTAYLSSEYTTLSINNNIITISNSSSVKNSWIWWNIPVVSGQNYNINFSNFSEGSSSTNNNISYKFANEPITEYQSGTGGMTDYTVYTKISKTNKSATVQATDNYLILVIRAIPNITNTIENLQVEKGTQATPYEPYTGGYASPNPNYPQNIKVIKEECNINLSNKNLLNEPEATRTGNGITVTINGSKITYTGEATASGVNVLVARKQSNFPLGQYTFSVKNNKLARFIAFRLYDKNGNELSMNKATNEEPVIVNITSEVSSYMYYIGLTTGETYDEEIYIQLEPNLIATNYIEHQGQIYPITLSEGMFLGSIGTASSYIYGEKNDWKLYNGLSKVVLNGNENENWSISASETNNYNYRIDIANTSSGRSLDNECISNLYQYAGGVINDTNTREGIAVVNPSQTTTQIRIRYGIEQTIESFKTFLTNNNLIVYYKLNTPTETDITDQTLITQLNNIADNLQTYENQTIVFTSSEDLEPNIQFNYRAK